MLEQSDVRAYREAVLLLREIRTTLAAAARVGEFSAEIERIREANRRRPKLMSMLADEDW